MNDTAALVAELRRLIATLETALPPPAPAPDFAAGLAFRWRSPTAHREAETAKAHRG